MDKKEFIIEILPIWDKVNHFTLKQAAYLWRDKMPPAHGELLPPDVHVMLIRMVNALKTHSLKNGKINLVLDYQDTSLGRMAAELSTEINKAVPMLKRDRVIQGQIEKLNQLFEGKSYDEQIRATYDLKITRGALVEWANHIGEKTLFLFPEEREEEKALEAIEAEQPAELQQAKKDEAPKEATAKSMLPEIDYEKEMDNLLCACTDEETIIFAHSLRGDTYKLEPCGENPLFANKNTNEWETLIKMVSQGSMIEKRSKTDEPQKWDINRKLRSSLNKKIGKFIRKNFLPYLPDNFKLFEKKAGGYLFKFEMTSQEELAKKRQVGASAKSAKKPTFE